jgi:hypothetical protein
VKTMCKAGRLRKTSSIVAGLGLGALAGLIVGAVGGIVIALILGIL